MKFTKTNIRILPNGKYIVCLNEDQVTFSVTPYSIGAVYPTAKNSGINQDQISKSLLIPYLQNEEIENFKDGPWYIDNEIF